MPLKVLRVARSAAMLWEVGRRLEIQRPHFLQHTSLAVQVLGLGDGSLSL